MNREEKERRKEEEEEERIEEGNRTEPVVGSSNGALREFVISAHNGFLIEPDDFKSVNACIHTLHHDRQRLLKMSCAAFQTYKERPKWRETMESIHRFLTGLAGSIR